MKPDAPDVKWIEEPELGLAGRLYLPAIVQGMATTARHLVGPKVTLQYPEQEPQFGNSQIYRGVHRLNRDEQGRVKCVACFLCATACPAHCIDIIGAEAPWDDREKYPESFTIDELRCIYCGMCEEACPVDAIELTSLYDLTGVSREEMIYDKEKLLSVYDQTKQAEPSALERRSAPERGLAEPRTTLGSPSPSKASDRTEPASPPAGASRERDQP